MYVYNSLPPSPLHTHTYAHENTQSHSHQLRALSKVMNAHSTKIGSDQLSSLSLLSIYLSRARLLIHTVSGLQHKQAIQLSPFLSPLMLTCKIGFSPAILIYKICKHSFLQRNISNGRRFLSFSLNLRLFPSHILPIGPRECDLICPGFPNR